MLCYVSISFMLIPFCCSVVLVHNPASQKIIHGRSTPLKSLYMQQIISIMITRLERVVLEVSTGAELVKALRQFSSSNTLQFLNLCSLLSFFLLNILNLRILCQIQIAIKRLKAMSAKAEMEFAVEVEILGRVRHKNLLGLRGFYAGGDERLIVYDYMPNHSLITHLHGQLASDCLLDWPRRISIAIGSAEGIS